MKNTATLKKLYTTAAKNSESIFYTFEDFLKDARLFLRDIEKNTIIMGMTVSRSGMTRHFNTVRFNVFLNICYHQKISPEPVKVSGCGMDMAWYLLYKTCKDLLTEKELQDRDVNSLCSMYTIL